jgi:hypothetical protein
MNARVSDLSRMGCYVEMMSPFPLGSNLKMRILKNKTPFLAQGPGAFSSAEQIRLREKWIDELSGVLPFEDADSDEGLPALATQVSGNETSYVLNEVIIALMRKGVLSDGEAKGMPQKLIH